MEALILSCGTGGGHDSAAKAVLEEMEKRGHHAVMMNPYTLKSDRLAGGINKTYISLARDVPGAFGAVYKLGDLYRQLPFRSPVYFVNHGMDEVLESYFSEHPCDVVLTTHLFAAEILTNMKLHGIRIPKTIFIATDYVCIPFTEETECDAYVIPAEDLKPEFVRKGIPEEKLYPLGIPTAGCFRETEPRESIRRRLGLEPGRKYILVAGGSMGGGRIARSIHKLQAHFAGREEVSLIVVCGSNRALFDRLNQMSCPGTRVIGYCEDMASYLRACDLFITKPGGLSSTEAAVCGVPIFHTAMIPGCETFNARYFSSHGMSVSGDLDEAFLSTLDQYLSDPRLPSAMAKRQREGVNSRAAADICDLAESMAAGTFPGA